jgi:hypothetical protein
VVSLFALCFLASLETHVVGISHDWKRVSSNLRLWMLFEKVRFGDENVIDGVGDLLVLLES